jgi:dephospho-CoA kinase
MTTPIKFVPAVVGMAGSGKSVVTQRMEELGYHVIRFGQLVVDEVARRGLEVNPDNERLVREELRQKFGMDVCAQLSLPKIEAYLAKGEKAAIDGLYSMSEYETLLKKLAVRLILIAVYTPRELRYARLAQRPERPFTREQAVERDFMEIRNIEKGGPIALADYTIFNDGSAADLRGKVESLIRQLEA